MEMFFYWSKSILFLSHNQKLFPLKYITQELKNKKINCSIFESMLTLKFKIMHE